MARSFMRSRRVAFYAARATNLAIFVGFERTENHDNFGLALLIFTSCLVGGILIPVYRLSLMRECTGDGYCPFPLCLRVR